MVAITVYYIPRNKYAVYQFNTYSGSSMQWQQILQDNPYFSNYEFVRIKYKICI